MCVLGVKSFRSWFKPNLKSVAKSTGSEGEARLERPVCVFLLACFSLCFGLLFLPALLYFSVGLLLGVPQFLRDPGLLRRLFPDILEILALWLFPIISFLVAYGLFKLRNWARWATIAVAVYLFFSSALLLARSGGNLELRSAVFLLAEVALSVGVVSYLYRRDIKAVFGS